jgi:hypothetical protein
MYSTVARLFGEPESFVGDARRTELDRLMDAHARAHSIACDLFESSKAFADTRILTTTPALQLGNDCDAAYLAIALFS